MILNLEHIVMSQIPELIIDRSLWQRQSPEVERFLEDIDSRNDYDVVSKLPCYYESFLFHRTNNRMCCLGIYCLKAGIPQEKLDLVCMPDGLSSELREMVPALFDQNQSQINAQCNKVCYDLSVTNDNELWTDEQKEAKIIELFNKIGVKVTFTGPTIQEEIEQVRTSI